MSDVPKITTVELRGGQPSEPTPKDSPIEPAPSLPVDIPTLSDTYGPMTGTTKTGIVAVIISIVSAGLALFGFEIPPDAIDSVVLGGVSLVSGVIAILGKLSADAPPKAE